MILIFYTVFKHKNRVGFIRLFNQEYLIKRQVQNIHSFPFVYADNDSKSRGTLTRTANTISVQDILIYFYLIKKEVT